MIKIFIKTFGCQANVADSAALLSYLKTLGCSKVSSEEFADIVIINTCAIRELAEEKFFSYLGTLKEYKLKKKHLKIGVIGCIASYRKEEILKRFDHVNFIFKAKDDLDLLKEFLSDLIFKLNSKKNIPHDFSNKKSLVVNCGVKFGAFKTSDKEFKQSLVNIMTGCNNYCSYCIVPFVRGREKSYSSKIILDRVKGDVQLGAKEITLIGQNVNSYKDPETAIGFTQLLEKVAQIEGEFWVRFISPHPKDMTKDVLHVMAAYKDKLCAFIHHPLQSGSNKILKAMNRTYTVEKYLEQIEWIKEILPHATISTDVIVGFPGERQQDYEQTRQIMEKVKFDNIYAFIYSPRKYTKAALLKDDCSKEEKSKRFEDLRLRQIEIVSQNNTKYLDKTIKCLVEKRLQNGKFLARTQGNTRVLFDGDNSLINNFVNLKIEKTGSVNLSGSLI